MSLVATTVDIKRNVEVEDVYGGVTETLSTVYSALACTVNYIMPRAVETREGTVGPGQTTRGRCVIKFEPIPASTTILIGDRAVTAAGDSYLVVGVRTYEYTLQLDAELIQ